MTSNKNRRRMVRRLLPKLANFGTGGKSRGPSQEALFSFGLAPADLPPKAAKVPVNTPTAKKPKYISAAGCRTSWCNKSGSWKSTFPRLYMPITTSKSRTAMKNTTFRIRITLIIYRARLREIQLPGKAPPLASSLLATKSERELGVITLFRLCAPMCQTPYIIERQQYERAGEKQRFPEEIEDQPSLPEAIHPMYSHQFGNKIKQTSNYFCNRPQTAGNHLEHDSTLQLPAASRSIRPSQAGQGKSRQVNPKTFFLQTCARLGKAPQGWLRLAKAKNFFLPPSGLSPVKKRLSFAPSSHSRFTFHVSRFTL